MAGASLLRATAFTLEEIAMSAKGSIYGLETTPERFSDRALMPRTQIKGLYLGGVDASTPGIAGGLSGGILSAMAAEPLKGAKFLQPIMKRPQT